MCRLGEVRGAVWSLGADGSDFVGCKVAIVFDGKQARETLEGGPYVRHCRTV